MIGNDIADYMLLTPEMFINRYRSAIIYNKENAIVINSHSYFGKNADKVVEDDYTIQDYLKRHFENGLPDQYSIYVISTKASNEELEEFKKEFGVDTLCSAPVISLFKDGKPINSCFLADGSDVDDIIAQIKELQ